MAINIGPKISVDGETEYRSAMQRIIQTQKTLTSEMQLLTTSFDKNATSQDKAKASISVLTKQVENQKNAVSLLADMYEKSKAKTGADSIETLKYADNLNKARAELNILETSLAEAQTEADKLGDTMQETGDDLGTFSSGAEDAGEASFSLSSAMEHFTGQAMLDAVKKVGEQLVEFSKQCIEAAAEVAAVNAQFSQTFGDLEGEATSALEAISKETGISTSRLKKSYSTIYAYARTAGADSAEALDISSRAILAAADNAAYYDRSIEDVTESLLSFMKGNYANDAALGISATETTRNTKANEMYATSFNDLSESQKVGTLLAMVEAGNAASGALGQAAREADAWANVTGELSDAWTQFMASIGTPMLEAVTPIIQGITEALQDMADVTASGELRSALKDFEKSVSDADKTLAETTHDIERNAYMAEFYANRLEELEGAGLDTASSQREYANAVSALNDLYPELNLHISEQTGLLDENSRSRLTNLDAMKQQALYEAQEARYNTVLTAQAEAKVRLQEAEADLLEINAKISSINDELLSSTGQTATWWSNFANSNTVSSEMQSIINEYNALWQEQQRLNAAIADGSAEVEAYDVELEGLAAVFGTATEAVEETSSSVDALSDSYNTAFAEAQGSINSQIGLFDELATESDYSAASIIENWANQKKAFDNYSDNLQKAIDMGLDEALVSQLSDGSEESMLILDAFVNDVDISVDEINAAFAENTEARENMAGTMADVRVALDEELDGMVEDATTAGGYVGEGVAAGILGKMAVIQSAMGSIASAGIQRFNETYSINSPSRVMKKQAAYVPQGAALGIKEDMDVYLRSIQQMAEAGTRAFADSSGIEDALYVQPYIYRTTQTVETGRSATFGDVQIMINQQPGEDAQELAYRVMDIMQTEISRKGVSLRG